MNYQRLQTVCSLILWSSRLKGKSLKRREHRMSEEKLGKAPKPLVKESNHNWYNVKGSEKSVHTNS